MQLNWLKPEWTIPQRLLQKRPLTLHKHSVDNLGFRHEWLVKWCGLDYKHATWELENSSIFNSPEGQCLIYDFENRVLKAKIENKVLLDKIFVMSMYIYLDKILLKSITVGCMIFLLYID